MAKIAYFRGTSIKRALNLYIEDSSGNHYPAPVHDNDFINYALSDIAKLSFDGGTTYYSLGNYLQNKGNYYFASDAGAPNPNYVVIMDMTIFA